VKVIKFTCLMFCFYIVTHLIFLILFIVRPLWIVPEEIKGRDALFHLLGEPKYKYDEKGFVAWEKYDKFIYSTIEYRDEGMIVTSNVLKENNLQIFKNSKVWDGKKLYQCVFAY